MSHRVTSRLERPLSYNVPWRVLKDSNLGAVSDFQFSRLAPSATRPSTHINDNFTNTGQVLSTQTASCLKSFLQLPFWPALYIIWDSLSLRTLPPPLDITPECLLSQNRTYTYKDTHIKINVGSPYQSRTGDSTVKGWWLDHLPNGPYKLL